MRLRRFVQITLFVMGVLALFALVENVAGYISSVESARGLSLEIADLQFIDDDNPRVHISFTVRNESPLGIRIERYHFRLFLNQERVGSSYSKYLGTDPGIDDEAHRRANTIEQVLASGGSLDLEFTAYIYSAQMDVVRRAQRSGVMSWYAMADFRVILPYARDETMLRLPAGLEE